MDLKQMAAQKAITLITNNSKAGLGAGATMAYMAGLLAAKIAAGLQIQLYTSSAETEILLQQKGFVVHPVAGIDKLDFYFDGCDQVDENLNAFKSGGGIHTKEKLLASMAAQFILVGDESKFVQKLTTQYPLVVEVLPDAMLYVICQTKKIFTGVRYSQRMHENGKPVVTTNGNYLGDIWFDTLPDIRYLDMTMKGITGVVDTSLFYGLAHKAVLAGLSGVRIIEKMDNR